MSNSPVQRGQTTLLNYDNLLYTLKNLFEMFLILVTLTTILAA